MTAGKPANINEYIAGFPPDTQNILEQLRATVKKAAPGCTEVISYGMPTFNLNGSYVVYIGAYKNHIGLYPAPKNNEEFKEELSAYKGGPGTIQFPLNQPMPLDLVTRIVKFQVAENKRTNKEKKKATNAKTG